MYFECRLEWVNSPFMPPCHLSTPLHRFLASFLRTLAPTRCPSTPPHCPSTPFRFHRHLTHLQRLLACQVSPSLFNTYPSTFITFSSPFSVCVTISPAHPHMPIHHTLTPRHCSLPFCTFSSSFNVLWSLFNESSSPFRLPWLPSPFTTFHHYLTPHHRPLTHLQHLLAPLHQTLMHLHHFNTFFRLLTI